jgi:hypothetical protein
MRRILCLVLLAFSVPVFGQDSFKKEIDDLYNFHPHQLKREEQEKLFPALDTFFHKITSDTARYLPLLRQELKSDDHFPYFYYDCAHLLMTLTKNRADKEICAEAFSKTDIRDLSPKMYVTLINTLAVDSINVTKAALKILEEPDFSFFIPQHAMNFMQGYCLTYCLVPLNPDLFVDALIQTFKETKYINAQKSIITTLWFTYSCQGDAFLQSLNATNTLSGEVADYAKKLLANDKLGKDYKKMLKTITEDQLEEIKFASLKRFSDEAIYDLDFVTKARRAKFDCR